MTGADPRMAGEQGSRNRKHGLRKRMLLLIAAVVVAGAGAAATGVFDQSVSQDATPSDRTASAGGAAAQPLSAIAPMATVRVTLPEAAAATSGLELPGESAAIDEAVLYARVDGYVSERFADIGDRVAANQTLALIDAPELAHQLDEAQAQLRQAEANLRLARVNLQRAEQLVGQGHVSRQVFDEREAELGIREADVAAARAAAARLQQLLDFRRVAAPFAGVVVARNVNKGDLVEADAPEPGRYLFRIARLDVLRVFVDVPQSSVGTVRVGTPAHVRFSEFPQAQLSGAVVRTAGALDPASRSMRVEVQLANPEGLPAGMIGRVTFASDAPPGLLTLPINALITRAEGTFVAVVTAGSTVRFAPVEPGRNLGPRIEIKNGLDRQERVIVNPNSLLREGDRVIVQG